MVGIAVTGGEADCCAFGGFYASSGENPVLPGRIFRRAGSIWCFCRNRERSPLAVCVLKSRKSATEGAFPCAAGFSPNRAGEKRGGLSLRVRFFGMRSVPAAAAEVFCFFTTLSFV